MTQNCDWLTCDTRKSSLMLSGNALPSLPVPSSMVIRRATTTLTVLSSEHMILLAYKALKATQGWRKVTQSWHS
ncbi:hypothetical protein Pelo_7489 [Pelomyxa schiedti]|nr:hypothetical protein Pelo_7489 [Pelomyxa schiedti]